MYQVGKLMELYICTEKKSQGGRGKFIFQFVINSPRGVGRSRRYCNTRPTRGSGGVNSRATTQFQKSV